MSGWLAVRTARVEADPLAPARSRAGPDAAEWKSDDGLSALLAWRRTSGEHRYSGRLLPGLPGGRVAWVGLCLEDGGESTSEAARTLLSPTDARLAGLNGEFAAAVCSPSGELVATTDRHGHYPVYLVRGPGFVAASTDASVAFAFLDRVRFDPEAVDFLLRCGELLEDRTPLKDVVLLPPASSVRLAPGAPFRPSRYWRLRHAGDAALDLEDATNGLGERLRSASRRIERAGVRLVAPLSGGLDSRLIVGLCENPERVPTFTWGADGCRDLRYAEMFAARVGSPHRSIELRPEDYPEVWARGVVAAGGCVGIRDMYILPFAPLLARAGDVALNGLAGDAFLGGNFLKRAWLNAPTLDALADATWAWRTPEPEIALTAGLAEGGPPPGAARETWARSLRARDAGGRPIETLVDWLLENRVFRFTNAGTQLLRTAVESYSPFFDRDVVDLLVKVPLEARLKHRLYFAILRRFCPAAAAVPWQRTALAPRWGFAASLASLAFHRGARALGRRFGLNPFPAQAVASPADWFRGPWAAPARALLFDARTLERGLLRPDGLLRLWDAHQSGADVSRALGVAIGLELFAREVADKILAEKGS
ncbi:MAG TPA: asparagine synthase-related protein [Planctomycetota bacterium]